MLSKHAHTDDVYDVNKVFNLLQQYKNDELSDIKQYYTQYRKPLFDVVMNKLKDLLVDGSKTPKSTTIQESITNTVPANTPANTDIEELKSLLNAELQSSELDFKT